MRPAKRALIAVIAAVSSSWVPVSCFGDTILTGSWTGWDTIVTYDPSGAQTTTYQPDSFGLQYDLSLGSGYNPINLNIGATFGELIDVEPQSLSGSALLLGGGGYDGIDNVNFFVSFDSIPPDGVLDNSNSSAGYFASYFVGHFGDPGGGFYTVSFSTTAPDGVPEPSSLVEGAIATMIVVGFAQARACRGRAGRVT